jgi:hypothetical protein
MKKLSFEIYVIPLQAEDFAGAKTIHSENAKERSPRFFGNGKYLLKLIDREESGFVSALGQGTAIAKDFYQSRKFKRALLKELEDIREQLFRNKLGYARQLQIYANQGLEPAAPGIVHNLFFREYFKQVFSRLNREQRLSYQLIHGMVDSINAGNVEFIDLAKKLLEEHRHGNMKEQFLVDIEIWADRLQGLYLMTAECIWHVNRHLGSPNKPPRDLMGPEHEKFAQHEDQNRKEIEQIITSAKGIPRADFDKAYDEKFFRR